MQLIVQFFYQGHTSLTCLLTFHLLLQRCSQLLCCNNHVLEMEMGGPAKRWRLARFRLTNIRSLRYKVDELYMQYCQSTKLMFAVSPKHGCQTLHRLNLSTLPILRVLDEIGLADVVVVALLATSIPRSLVPWTAATSDGGIKILMAVSPSPSYASPGVAHCDRRN
jgi:hypothetical protein